MKNRQFIVFALLLACPLLLHGQETFLCGKESCNKGYIRHPWYGKKVGYIGDSITDPNCYGDNIKKYWDFLKEWLDITPYVYGVSGRQWNDVPRQAEQLKKEPDFTQTVIFNDSKMTEDILLTRSLSKELGLDQNNEKNE